MGLINHRLNQVATFACLVVCANIFKCLLVIDPGAAHVTFAILICTIVIAYLSFKDRYKYKQYEHRHGITLKQKKEFEKKYKRIMKKIKPVL